MMKKIKYILLSFLIIGFFACEDDLVEDLRDVRGNNTEEQVFENFTQGNANFSKFVAIGNSLTAGFADGSLYKIAQENSTPAIMAQQFAAVANGGAFTQPLVNDNIGGLLLAGTQITNQRLVFDGSGPVPLNSLIPTAIPTTDIAISNNYSSMTAFNNLGVPGAKSFHLLAPNYGAVSGVPLGTANPYFARIATSPSARMIDDAIAQQPTFISLWIGNNDVLGYATTGGDGSDPITPLAGAPGIGFEQTYQAIVASIVGSVSGVQGIIANIPNVTAIPHFTTVPHNPLEPVGEDGQVTDFGMQVPLLNNVFGALNPIFQAIDPSRQIVFSETDPSPVVIHDESLTDISAQIEGALNASPTFPGFLQSLGINPAAAPIVASLLGNRYGQSRQATANDLFVLPSSAVIGEVNTDVLAALITAGLPPQVAGQFSIEGITLPLEDKWVLIPNEQNEIENAINQYNTVIEAAASANGFALLDANTLLDELAVSGIETSGLLITSDLVTGGVFSLDGVHPNSRGYAFIANEMLKAIDETYGSNFEASGNLVDISTYNTNYSPSLLQ